MSVNKRTAVLTGLAGAGAAGAVAFALVGTPALAGDPTPAPTTSSSVAPPTRPDREAQRAQRQDELAAALAAELGIDKEKVAAALEKVQADRASEANADRLTDLKTRLDAAVKAGTLTAEESAAILKAAEAGVLPAGGGPGGHGHGPGGR